MKTKRSMVLVSNDSQSITNKKIVLERAGIIDPDSIEDYLANYGYLALDKVLT
ncbi:MAG: hypothetical protein HOD92_06410, partial [Deltaproteobacteria bacterium]|nr:hypothetical protein [Deltaproteobacteria bacterium]